MSVSLELAKQQLRVDYDDEDELISAEIAAAEEYARNAVGDYNESDPLVRLLILAIVTELYQNRAVTITSGKVSDVVHSITTQLALKYGDEYED